MDTKADCPYQRRKNVLCVEYRRPSSGEEEQAAVVCCWHRAGTVRALVRVRYNGGSYDAHQHSNPDCDCAAGAPDEGTVKHLRSLFRVGVGVVLSVLVGSNLLYYYY